VPVAPPAPPSPSPRIHVERAPDGRLTYEYDVAPADAPSVMSICLLILAKIVSKLPTAA
jgi:hypothetical protein